MTNNINEEVSMKKRKPITLIDLLNAALTQGATTQQVFDDICTLNKLKKIVMDKRANKGEQK